MRYKIVLSYDGAAFCGWQIQPSAPSVQQTLEEALSTLLGARIAVTGAGRTDTAVNAAGYVAHFDFDGAFPGGDCAGECAVDCGELCRRLNAILPESVCITGVSPAAEDFHARFDARRREYTYFLHREKDPFLARYSYYYSYPDVDFEAMNRAAQALLGRHDFSCFEKTGADSKTSVCTVFEAAWHPYVPTVCRYGSPAESLSCVQAPEMSSSVGPHRCASLPVPPLMMPRVGPPEKPAFMGYPRVAQFPEPGAASAPAGRAPQYWYFRIAADRFLRNMVRAVVGTLLEVGRGKRSVESIADLVGEALPENAAGKVSRRSLAGESVPGHALFLSRIEFRGG